MEVGVRGGWRRRRRDGPDSIARNLNKSIFSPLKAAIFQSDGCCKHHSSAQHYETRRSTFLPLLFSFLEKGGKMAKIYWPFVGFYFCGTVCRWSLVSTDVVYLQTHAIFLLVGEIISPSIILTLRHAIETKIARLSSGKFSDLLIRPMHPSLLEPKGSIFLQMRGCRAKIFPSLL